MYDNKLGLGILAAYLGLAGCADDSQKPLEKPKQKPIPKAIKSLDNYLDFNDSGTLTNVTQSPLEGEIAQCMGYEYDNPWQAYVPVADKGKIKIQYGDKSMEHKVDNFEIMEDGIVGTRDGTKLVFGGFRTDVNRFEVYVLDLSSENGKLKAKQRRIAYAKVARGDDPHSLIFLGPHEDKVYLKTFWDHLHYNLAIGEAKITKLDDNNAVDPGNYEKAFDHRLSLIEPLEKYTRDKLKEALPDNYTIQSINLGLDPGNQERGWLARVLYWGPDKVAKNDVYFVKPGKDLEKYINGFFKKQSKESNDRKDWHTNNLARNKDWQKARQPIKRRHI